ncbi:MAG: 4-hydroxythreonine-4-phosphate dehydrogenase PdxA [Deltaproteobacteria bacterium]
MKSSSFETSRGSLPPLGITMGCPAGVGPEIIVKALSRKEQPFPRSNVVVIGDVGAIRRAARITGIEEEIREWKAGGQLSDNAIHVLPVTTLDIDKICIGKPSPETGTASFAYLERGIELARAGVLSGIVTAPLSKLGFRLAGIAYPGHTEVLAEKTGSRRFAMMLAGSSLRVVLVTIHCPIREVPSLISVDRVRETIEITHEALVRDFGMDRPRIAVAGLNPHAGESGMFGDEEGRIIAPAIEAARLSGCEASGPHPPDTVFHRAVHGHYDAVVCQYHDQGLIPFKLLHFRDGVNVTLGLPIVRTSVDHGTAYDIAGTGKADPESLCAAIGLAFSIARNRSCGRCPHEGNGR